MHWCVHALRLAGDNVGIGRLPVLDYRTRSKSQPSIIPLRTSLWNHIAVQRGTAFAKQWTLMLLRSVVTFGSPYCVMRLLNSLERAGSPTNHAWLWLIGIGVSSVGENIIHYHIAWIQWSELGIPKALRVKDSKHPESFNSNGALKKPEAINLISSDTLAFSKFTAVNHILPFSLVKFLMASTLVAITVTMATLPIHTMVIKHEQKARKSLTAARDRKIKVVNEAVEALRQIKFHGLETQWEERINQFRQEELYYMRKTFMASSIRLVWKLTAPLLVAAASVCTFTSSASISPSIIFPMIELLPHLQGTLGVIPVVIQDLLDARSNARRMEEYLRKPEQNKILDPSRSGRVLFRNASVAWPRDEAQDKITLSSRFCLHNINLEFPSGELSIIYGQTGSGKTLLLSAILGEADLLGGSIEAPSVAEGQPVAFVSQTPWLQSATVKENILFGSSFNQERYTKVLGVCALSLDLAALPNGDETQIGPKGVKLSGGQRARVALARAIYSGATLLVLDDIFSALDASVSKDILQALTGELCNGRTRILVTYRVSICLPNTRYIVKIENNIICHQSITDLIEGMIIVSSLELAVRSSRSIEVKSNKRALNIIKTKRVEARSDLRVYTRYFTAAGGFIFTVVYLLGLVANLGVSIAWELLLNLYNFSGSVHTLELVFDMTSISSMLKSFIADARMVDNQLLMTLSEFLDCLVKMMVITVVGLYTSRYTSILTLAFLYTGLRVGKIYIKARLMVKRADVEPTATILEHFTSFIRTGIFLLVSNSDMSLVGFSLTFCMGLSGELFKAVNAFGQLEIYMGAAGAMTAYTELQTEDQGGINVPGDWPSQGKIQVDNLNVAYSASLPLVLKEISFTAEPGQRIGIAGRTGAGKSSLALALLCLIEPCGGLIHVDGINILTVKLQLLRLRIVFVPQDPVLFSDILRRVKLLAEDSGEGKKSCLLTLDSPISAGGANILQGQQQLLCLGQILVQDLKIVILDEATSATIVSFDQVLVIDDGRIAEAGNPADLLRGQGLFYNLVQDSGDKEFLIKTVLG
ncbi:P-loop containing nucleoside triphosphate hydrolase protein [Aspergillus alliaceus]|uniref:P-loop containing nucleoside triphosphate hydrolase protein n=1 Tax=Petromyces alliaceus TaxID=209559 RepID=A0A5N7BUY8_PETAA|nr:P-loop containing nucleoside triphosphate hydrolase protein [Aspergillus alliaceus]